MFLSQEHTLQKRQHEVEIPLELSHVASGWRVVREEEQPHRDGVGPGIDPEGTSKWVETGKSCGALVKGSAIVPATERRLARKAADRFGRGPAAGDHEQDHRASHFASDARH